MAVDKDGVLIGPNAGGSAFIYVYPKGLYKLLKFMKKHYNQNLTIYITENGLEPCLLHASFLLIS